MPGPKPVSRRQTSRTKGSARAAADPGRLLLVIDHEKLQRTAWAEFHTVRKRLDQAMRTLHRHEEIDAPAYEAWLHRTFPLQVTALRELTDEVTAKAARVRAVQARAAATGRSHKRLWQEEKERAANPEAFRQKSREAEADPDDEDATERRQEARLEDFAPRPAPTRTPAARDIFRRLVQHLHPDRGGAWTPARQQLWHEVQRAWAAGDADWLARLEVEWETAHEVVGPQSPLSRIRAAIEEVHAARRDLEHKLADYRAAPGWRFTKTEARRDSLARRVEEELAAESRALRRQLEHLNATIGAWDEDWTRAKTRPERRWGFSTFRRRKPGGPRR